MKSLNLGSALLVAFGLGVGAASAETVRGPEVPFGSGAAHSWVMLDEEGRPQQIGVSLTEAAVAEPGHEMVFVTVPLPDAARAAGYDHVSLDWMPHGHHPEQLFGVPHYDVHFYLVSEAERLAVDPAAARYLEKAAHEPRRALIPADYVPPPVLDPVPAMGVHWTDATHPVMLGERPFDHIFIYGAWDGKVTFLEPMITRDVFASKRSVSEEVKQPAEVAKAGWYPTSYRIEYNAETGTHDVILDGLVERLPVPAGPRAG